MLAGVLEQKKMHGQVSLRKPGLNKTNKCLFQRPQRP